MKGKVSGNLPTNPGMMLCWVFLTTSLVLSFSSVEAEHVKCSNKHISTALISSANCQPRHKVIRLDPPNNMTVDSMTPLYISVLRCGGACPTSSRSCVPTKLRTLDVPVIIGSCGVESGKCDKQCHTLSVLEETECQCNCLDIQKECGPGKQFMADSCSCRCKDIEAAKKCKDSGRVWETSTCSCGCALHSIIPCSTGMEFDNVTCSCTDISYIRESEASDNEARVARSNELVPGSDMLIIGVLSGVVLILLLIIMGLCRTVTYQRRKLNHMKLTDNAVGVNDPSYVSCSNPAPDDEKIIKYNTDHNQGLKTMHGITGMTNPRSNCEQQLLMESCDISNCGEATFRRNYREVESPITFGNPKLHINDQFARLLDCEAKDASDSIDSSGSRAESGFDSGRGGSGFDSSNSGIDPACTNPGSSKHHQGHDSMSVLSSALHSNNSNSINSVFSIGSRAPSRETPV